ncbi:MAG: alpha/beta fold hydrolase [Micropepsaceae bacterium]
MTAINCSGGVAASTRNSDPKSAAAALAVVEALYAFADEPARWDDVIAAVDALPVPLDPAKDAVASSILSHAARAAQMIERLNAGRAPDDVERSPWDAILLTSENRVRAVAGAASSRLAPFLTKPLAVGQAPAFSGACCRVIEEALATSFQRNEPTLAPFTLANDAGNERCFGVALPREIFPEPLAAEFKLGPAWAEPLCALVLLSDRTASAKDDSVTRRLGLTVAEARLAAKLLQGLQISEAAKELDVSVLTARTHLKNIFAKTGARRQSELIRLMTDLSKFPERAARATPTLTDATPRRFVVLPDGRRIFYREYGCSTCPATLYFHVGLAASLVMPEISRAAEKFRVRLIAFERPGFGQSTPRSDYTFASIAEDAEALLNKLKISSVALFGDGYGGAFAVAAAKRLNGRVRRLALRSPALGRSLANDRRSVLSALFRQSWIIPGVAELMHRGIRVSLVRSLMRHYAERSVADARRVAEPEFRDYFDAVIFDALERTGAGLAAELTLFASGAREDPSGLTCPISVWHGADHPGLPASDSVEAFGNHPCATLHILKDTGSYLEQAVFDDIFGWLAVPSSHAIP